ncbi:MAG: STAS domain-containing protein [Acidimicrobiales bacterium]
MRYDRMVRFFQLEPADEAMMSGAFDERPRRAALSPTGESPSGRSAHLRADVAGPQQGRAGPGMPGHARPSVVIGRYQGTIVVTVHGELDPSGAEHLDRMLADLIEGQGNMSLIVDLHDATATDPGRVSVLADAAECARRRGALLTFSKPSAVVREALRARGLDHLVDPSFGRAWPRHQPFESAGRRERRAHPAGRSRSRPEEGSHPSSGGLT